MYKSKYVNMETVGEDAEKEHFSKIAEVVESMSRKDLEWLLGELHINFEGGTDSLDDERLATTILTCEALGQIHGILTRAGRLKTT